MAGTRGQGQEPLIHLPWKKFGAHISPLYITYVAPKLKTVIFFSKQENILTNTCQSPYFHPPCIPFLPYNLAHILFDVKHVVRAHVWRLAEHAWFAVSFGVILWYNAPPLTTFDFILHILLIQSNPYTFLSYSQYEHSIAKLT